LSSGFVPDEPDRAGVVMSAVMNMEMDWGSWLANLSPRRPLCKWIGFPRLTTPG
jgi:hypothetical protein